MAHILVVDDSPTETHIISSALEKQGHRVSVAVDGKDGVEKATQLMPDLILMDVVMPELNGFQATRQLSNQSETANIPVIMVTTKNQKTDKMWAESQGAKGYVTKPFVENDLIDEVNRLLLS